jgi:large repetitive protein
LVPSAPDTDGPGSRLGRRFRLFAVCVLVCGAAGSTVLAESSSSRVSSTASLDARAQSRLAFAPSRLIVRYKAGTSRARRLSLRSRIDATFVRRLALPDTELVRSAGSIHAAIAELERSPRVRYAERDDVVNAATTPPNDPYFGSQWGLLNDGQAVNGSTGMAGVDVNALPAWDISRGAKQVIAVVDTGLAGNQPDLTPNFWSNPGEIPGNGIDDDGDGHVDDIRGWDFIDSDSNPDAVGNWHGTAVAGTAAAVADNTIGISGVAPQAEVMSVRALDDAMQGNISTLADGIVYAADEGADVINLSLLTSGTDLPQALSDAVGVARAHGAVVVAAAGNYARSNDSVPIYPCNLPQPNLICVASIDQDGSLSSFSDYGAASVDVGAPGGNILSMLLSGYAFKNGTSLAAPHVAGIAALIRAMRPGLSADQVVQVIERTVVPMASLAGKTSTGGRVDAAAALAALLPDTVISSGPSGITNDPTPTFTFASSEDSASFECRVDSKPFGYCGVPMTLPHLNDGSHTLTVRGVDPQGNADPTPASRTFSVQTASVSVSGATLVVTAAQGAKDNLAITKPSSSTLRVTDIPQGLYSGSGVHASSGCARSGDYTANCGGEIARIQIVSGDQGDNVINSTSTQTSIYGEAGNDSLTGGSSPDALVGGAGADALNGMNGNDQLFARDTAADMTIDCGSGSDSADLDKLPKDPDSKVIGCETTIRR